MSFNFEEFLKTHKVHPETIAFFLARAAENPKPYYEIGVEEARRTSREVCMKNTGPVNFDGTDTEVIIPSPDIPGGLPASVYRPKGCDSLEAPPIVAFFHGGGNTVGSRQTHEASCKIIASQVPCIFVNVEYRLSPEHKYPANIDDAETAVRWIAANKTAVPCIFVNVEYRLSPEHKYPANIDDAETAVRWIAANKTAVGGTAASKFGVSGDSAGARLAAIACHEIKGGVDFQVLVYPAVGGGPWPSEKEFEDGPVLSRLVWNWFVEQYGVPESEMGSTRVSVILNKDFTYMPSTLMVVAELDPLRDGCYAYHKKLQDAGVTSELKTIKGVPHAFWNLPGAFPESCGEAYKTTVEFIQKCCGLK